MTSSNDFWPKFVMARRSSSDFSMSWPMVSTWARFRQLRGRSDKSSSSIGRAGSGVDGDQPDRGRALAPVGREVAPTLLDGDVGGQAPLGVQGGDVQLGVQDLD